MMDTFVVIAGRFACGLALILFSVPAPGLELDYKVTLEDLASQTLQIELTITGWEQTELRLRTVPTYMDNPTAAANGQVVRNLAAWTPGGLPVAMQVAPDDEKEPVYLISGAPDTLRVAYELFVDFVPSRQTAEYPIRNPFMDPQRAWLYGNYVFCHPELADSKIDYIRRPLNIQVRFQTPAGVPLVGLPSAQLELANLYTLMSLQFGFGDFQVTTAAAGDYPFRIITPDSSSFTSAERDWLHERTGELVATVTEIFGGAPFPSMSFYYFRAPGIGGLEGAYACQAYLPVDVDLTDPAGERRFIFALTALHEFFHTWIPIGLFAADDPWFKEGLTSYYGQVLSCRLGWLSSDSWQTWHESYGDLLRSNPLIDEVALTDARIWEREYESEDWRTLTYDRGQAVSLLLDVRIRKATENRKSLDDVLPLLFQRYLHGSFSHDELLDTIAVATGYAAVDFFAAYVEGTTAPSVDEVAQALEQAAELGVFTPRK